jgi:hypothetical protein
MLVLNKHNGQLTYDGIQEMAYLAMVVSGEGIEGFNIRFFLISVKKSCMSTCVLILLQTASGRCYSHLFEVELRLAV